MIFFSLLSFACIDMVPQMWRGDTLSVLFVCRLHRDYTLKMEEMVIFFVYSFWHFICHTVNQVSVIVILCNLFSFPLGNHELWFTKAFPIPGAAATPNQRENYWIQGKIYLYILTLQNDANLNLFFVSFCFILIHRI